MREGIAVSLDSLGESVTDAGQAHASAAIYHEVLDEIQARGLKANVSVKLTQIGMDLDPELAESIVRGMLVHAEEADTFVRIDMEGSEYTEATLQMTERLHKAGRGAWERCCRRTCTGRRMTRSGWWSRGFASGCARARTRSRRRSRFRRRRMWTGTTRI